MKILFIIPYPPVPPITGGAIRIFNLIKEVGKYNDVSIFGVGYPFKKDEIAKAYGSKISNIVLTPRQWSRKFPRLAQVRSLFSKHSYYYFLGWSADLQRELSEEFANHEYDIIQTEYSHMASYNLQPRAIKILDSPDVEFDFSKRARQHSRGWLRKLHYDNQHQKTFHEEVANCNRQNAILVASHRDREVLSSYIPEIPKYVIPNGVDPAYFSSSGVAPIPNTLVFTGVMRYMPNSEGILHFLNEIFPRIVKNIPDVKIYIVGSDPPKEVLDRQSSNVIVTGFVEDVRPYIERATAYIVPLRMGSGTRLKVIEAMAMKKPTISTSIGCEGIDVKHEESILIADDPGYFSECVVRVLRDSELRRTLTRRAYEIMEQKYQWSVIGKQLQGVYEKLYRSKHQPTVEPPVGGTPAGKIIDAERTLRK